MGSFLDAEKSPQAKFKRESPFFTSPARQEGIYKKKPREFCLPANLSEENLIPEARSTAVEWFQQHGIKWHDGQHETPSDPTKKDEKQIGKPSNHLCDSQVCCVNFLFPFADRPEPLASLLQPVFSGLKRMLPISPIFY